MEKVASYKDLLCGFLGVIGAAISNAFGGWSSAMTTLLIFMTIDYITGLILGAMGKSKKSETGALNSYVGWKGLVKKGMTLVIVYVAYRIDIVIGTNYVKDMAIIAFVSNEAISIVENAGDLGVPMPDVVTRAVEVLKGKADGTAS